MAMMRSDSSGARRVAARRHAATAGALVLGLTLVIGAAAGSAMAQDAAPAPMGGAPPAPISAMRAFGVVREWVRQGQVTGAAPRERFFGAAVILRLDGRIVGRGSAMTGTGLEPEAGGAGLDALEIAAREAMAEAEDREPVPNDALREGAMAERAARMQISLELAGALTPIDPVDYAEAERVLAPGLDGVAARFGDSSGTLIAATFPGIMMTTGTLPHRALATVVTVAGDDSTLGLLQPGEVTHKHGGRLYRFRVVHLAQCEPGKEPIFLMRGARVIDQSEMTMGGVREMADRAAAHLVRLVGEARPKGAGGETGVSPRPVAGLPVGYDPLRDEVQMAAPREAAPARDQALMAIALSRYSALTGDVAAKAAADAIVAGLTRLVDEKGLSRPAEASAAVVGGVGGADVAAVVSGAFDAEKGFAEGVPPGARGLVALAMVRIASDPARFELEQDVAGDWRARAGAAVRRAFLDTAEAQFVGQMPFLGWAELELASLQSSADVPSAVSLRTMRTALWEHMLVAGEAGPDGTDLVGGVVFSPAVNPMPTWHSARAVAFAATMLGDPRLTEPGERLPEVSRLAGALRFLRQLQADESGGWLFANPARALGGVRGAPWDQAMSVDATAMTLIAATEMLRSVTK